MSENTGMNKLLAMQQVLMDEVPHDVRPDALVKMILGIKIIDTLLRYLNSTGHKPWRPNPLSPEVQKLLLAELDERIAALNLAHSADVSAGLDSSNLGLYPRQIVSAYGIIEESIEYLNALTGETRVEQLEELVDSLFFYMEQVIMSGFTWEQIEEEYHRKHAVNLERYRKAKEGDYSWDKRGEKEGL